MNTKQKKFIASMLTLCILSSGNVAHGGFWENFFKSSNDVITSEEVNKDYSMDNYEELIKMPESKRDKLFEKKLLVCRYNLFDNAQKGTFNEMDAIRAGFVFSNTAKGSLTKAATILAVMFALNNAASISDHIRNFYFTGSNVVRTWIKKLTCRGMGLKHYEVILNKIEKRLRSELVGQDEAITSIVNIMRGHFESMIESKVLGKKFEGGLVLYLIGMPATGKSTAMKIIEEEMKLTSFVGRMSDAEKDNGNQANTVASRLTKPMSQDNGKVIRKVDTPLTEQLKHRLPTLYCFDEIDKMRRLDSDLQKRNFKDEKGKIKGSSVDEMIRNFGDTGQINGIDASGSILIATSNETPEDLSQLESSLYNRYKGCHVHFRNFNKNDYIEIINRKVKSIQEYYKKAYSADIILSDSLMKHYSEKFEKENSGGRAVEVLMNDFRSVLKEYICREENKNKKGTKLLISYDNEINRMYVA